MNPFCLRSAEIGDAEAIARLVNLAFRLARFFTDEDRTSPEKVRGLLQTGKFLLLEEAGVLLGCVYIEQHGERGYLGLLSIDPGRQRSGLGSRLIAEAEAFCREEGCRSMDLTFANVRAELPAFYQRRGYAESGVEPFPAGVHTKVPCHLVRMTKALS